MKTLTALAVVCLVLAAARVPSAGVRAQGADAGHPVAIKIADKAMVKAVPFGLDEVRLLDGPFRDAMIRDESYLLSLDQDRLLHTFRLTAGLPTTAQPLGGWELPDVELRGHAVGHYLSAVSIMYASTGDVRFKQRADSLVAGFAAVQAAESTKFHPGYLSAFPEEFFDRVDARQRVWAPYYTIHKIMAGLLDAFLLTGNAQALDVLKKQGDWAVARNARLTEPQMQAMLQTEHGGMVEVLSNLYAVTGEDKYLAAARLFEHKRIVDPLARREDPLDNLHANTQIPKIIGAAREYELTGDPRYRDIAAFFWDRVVHHRSFAFGGNSDGEAFFPERETSQHLGVEGPETCNTYNMLKLTRHVFAWEPSAEAMDFYERALLNHILGSQDPMTGQVIYYCPLKPGAFKTFSTPTDSFWCCVGTGMENHGKYNDTIYFHDEASLYVNLFIPSELSWKDKGFTLRQLTTFPEEDRTALAVTAPKPVRLVMKIRYPGWATSGVTLAVNGRPWPAPGAPGSYIAIDREWRTGDTVTMRMPMALHMEALPDNPHIQALMYGPVVLAGDLGVEGLDGVNRYGPSAPPMGRVSPIHVPTFVANTPAEVLARVTKVAGSPLTFRTSGLGKPNDVTLMPLYKTFEPRYTVYWTVYDAAEFAAHKAELDALAARRASIAARTIDLVDVTSDASEQAHAYKAQGGSEGYVEKRRWRDARAGFLSYELTVAPAAPVTLVATYRGGEGPRRAFDILVNGEKVASESLAYHPAELIDREYGVPERLTRGTSRITVRFEPQGNARTAGIVELRTVRP